MTIRRFGPLAWRLALATIFVWFVASYVEIPAVIVHLTPATVWGVAAMQPILAVGYILTATRLSVLAGNVGLKSATRAVILCYGLNVIIPARLSELVKVAYLREHGKLPASDCLAAVVLERTLDALMLGLLAMLAASFLVVKVSVLAVAAMVVAVVCLVSLPLLSQPLVRMIGWLPLQSLASFMQRFVLQAAERIRSRSIWIALGISVCIWTVSVASAYAFLHISLGDRIGVPQALLVLAAVIAGASIPGLPGNFGTYEAGGVLALRYLGFGLEEALAISLAMHVGHISLAVLLTILLLMLERTGLGSLMQAVLSAMRKK